MSQGPRTLQPVEVMHMAPERKAKVAKPKAPRCKTCGAVIRVPQGWSRGPAVRRHYWAKHRDVMLPRAGR